MVRTVEGGFEFDVFISYARADAEHVNKLAQRLVQDGLRVWLDREQMRGGNPTLGKLADGIASSAHMIVCLSDSYIERSFTMFELQTNQTLDPANKQNRTIPVVVRSLAKPIPEQIRFLTYIDLADLTDETTYEAAYKKIAGEIRRAAPPPPITPIDREALVRLCESPFQREWEPNVALFETRLAAAAVCKLVLQRESNESPGDATLDSLVQRVLSDKSLPPVEELSLKTVQAYGNRMEDYVITRDSIQPGLAALRVLFDWALRTYFPDLGAVGGDPWERIWSRLPGQQGGNEREIPGSKYILKAPRLTLNSLGPLYAGRDKVFRHGVSINLVAISAEQDSAFFEEVSQFMQLCDARIVRPLDAGRVVVDGKRLCLYVVLEYVDGASAQDLAQRFGALPARTACELCQGVALALEALHTAEPAIVHGDVKPANIIVDRYGTVKLLCIGRSTGVTAEDAAAGTAAGRIDSYLFSSPEQHAGPTPRTDLFALRATLYYLLTGEYEARVSGDVPISDLAKPAVEAMEGLARCSTAKEAKEVLELAGQQLGGDPVKLNIAMDCYREGKELPYKNLGENVTEERAEESKPEPSCAQEGFFLLAEIPRECRRAWPLGGGRALVWESGADTLAILEEGKLVWRDTRPLLIRRVSIAPENRVAVAGWEGQVRWFEAGGLAGSADLDGTVGDVQCCADAWVAGTWKESLVHLTRTGEVVPLLEVRRGVHRIAVTDSGDRFAVADLDGGIAFYSSSGIRRLGIAKPLGAISGMAFAGHRLMVLLGRSLVAVEQDGSVGLPEKPPGSGKVRLFPSSSQRCCLLIDEGGNSWLMDERGVCSHFYGFRCGDASLSLCSVPRRFTIALDSGGYAYYRDGVKEHSWPDAVAISLSWDGRLVVLTFPGKVQIYHDPI